MSVETLYILLAVSSGVDYVEANDRRGALWSLASTGTWNACSAQQNCASRHESIVVDNYQSTAYSLASIGVVMYTSMNWSPDLCWFKYIIHQLWHFMEIPSRYLVEDIRLMLHNFQSPFASSTTSTKVCVFPNSEKAN